MKSEKDYIIQYIQENGSIVPATLGGKTFHPIGELGEGHFWGSEVTARCREIRRYSYKDYKLESKINERGFAEFTIAGESELVTVNHLDMPDNQAKIQKTSRERELDDIYPKTFKQILAERK